LDIAVAVAQLGGGEGLNTLKTACDDKSSPAELRLRAVRYMQGFLHNDSCYGVIEHLSASAPSANSRIQALDLIADQQNVRLHGSQKTRNLIIKALNDKEPAVRIEAAEQIAMIGTKEDAPSVERAMAREEDSSVRSSMEDALTTLRQN
jgi:hypothetical protein